MTDILSETLNKQWEVDNYKKMLSTRRFQFLNDNGYIIIKNILSKEFCNSCIKYLKTDFSGNKLNMPQTDIPYFYSNFEKNSIIYEILKNKTIDTIVKHKLGHDYKLLWFKIFNKIKWIGQDVEYHQEIIYNQNSNINVDDSFQLFIALDHHTLENGCLKLVPYTDKKILEHNEFIDRHGDHKYRVKSEILDKLIETNNIINCIFEPGDVVFFNDTIPHASASNPSQFDRFGVSISFVKNNVVIDEGKREKAYYHRKQKSKSYLQNQLDKLDDIKIATPNIFL